MDKIAGRNSVREALRSGRRVREVLMARSGKGQILEEIENLAREKGITVKKVKREELERLASSENHQGVLAMAESLPVLTLDELLQEENLTLLLALDQVQDPQNVGSIIRSAAFAGVQGVIYPARRSAGITSAVVRASAGGVEWVKKVEVVNLARALEALKDYGFWIVGGEPAGDELIFEVDFRLPVVLVIGSEGKGIRRLIREKCDHLVRIPCVGFIDSLNASVAAGIMLYEVIRQRQ